MTPANPTPDMPTDPAAEAVPAARKRPVRKPGKPDAVLVAAVEEARAGLLEVADQDEVGNYLGAVADADRLVTHRFTSLRPGYGGWYWYSTVARVPRSKKVTVSEVGLLPSDAALLAPEWVPWSDRLRPEDIAAEQEQQAREQAEQDGNADQEEDGQAQEQHDDATGIQEDE